jgi:hypothetical protein
MWRIKKKEAVMAKSYTRRQDSCAAALQRLYKKDYGGGLVFGRAAGMWESDLRPTSVNDEKLGHANKTVEPTRKERTWNDVKLFSQISAIWSFLHPRLSMGLFLRGHQ